MPRKHARKKYGYVFLPLYVEIAKEETEEEAIKRLGYEDLADVLNAMKEQDDVLADVIRQMREERGRVGGYDDSRFRERVEVIGQTVSLDMLRDSLTTFCVDRLGASWDERFGELIAFNSKKGHCNVPQKFPPNPSMGAWCTTQRKHKTKGTLSKERTLRLADIDFDFDPMVTVWETHFQELVEFKATHGHCNVPKGYKPNPELARFCHRQRRLRAADELSKNRSARLEAIGFKFDPFSTVWETRFQELVEFRATHEHCNVPVRYKLNPQLAFWCNNQRSKKKSGRLSEDRITRLEEIGFDFDPFSTVWELAYQELVEFKATHGHCNVPAAYKPNLQLGRWCSQQRTYNKNEDLSEDRVKRLEEIGFDFDPLSTVWEARFQELIEFKAEHHHCNVPARYKSNPKLGIWRQRQRTEKKTESLSEERIERLEAIGFEWVLN